MTFWNKFSLTAAAIVILCLIGAGLFFFLPHGLGQVAATKKQPVGDALVARGEYLATAADCAACHTTKGGKPFAGGLAFKLPFGTIYSSNITPDAEHGIGGWSEAEFVRALKSGIGKHGEDLYPAFPYTSYALLSDDDALAIFAYLKSLAPAASEAPQSDLAFPFNQRWLMRGWKLLFLPKSEMAQEPTRDAEWNKGAYLVEALAHCGECHTPRGLMFERQQAQALSGGDVEGWKAWNITSDKENGIGAWSDEELASYLSTGHAEGRGSASGGMREAVDLSLSKLPSEDIRAMISYLRTVPPVAGDSDLRKSDFSKTATDPTHTSDPEAALGRHIFAGACASCHGWQAAGRANPRAAIAGAHSFSDPEAANIIRVVLQGSSDGTAAPGATMPGFAAIYSDAEIAALANFMVGNFGGKKGTVTASDVAEARH